LYAGFIIVAQLTILTALSRRRERAIPRLILRHDSRQHHGRDQAHGRTGVPGGGRLALR
jgi:hypothetical protein